MTDVNVMLSWVMLSWVMLRWSVDRKDGRPQAGQSTSKSPFITWDRRARFPET